MAFYGPIKIKKIINNFKFIFIELEKEKFLFFKWKDLKNEKKFSIIK